MGIFIPRGTTFSIPAGGFSLSVDSTGKAKSNITPHLHYDVCPTWLDLAARHLSDAEERKIARVAAWASDDADAKGLTLEREFESAMQAIMASATALDALYAALKDKITIPAETFERWKTKRIARHRQITDVFSMAFKTKQTFVALTRKKLKEIFHLRDLAVHPKGIGDESIVHPEMQVGVEWRFVAFRAETARDVVNNTRGVVHELLSEGIPSTSGVKLYAEGLLNLLAARGIKS